METALKFEFTDRQVSPWGGVLPLLEMLRHSGFRDALKGVGLPARGSPRGYAPEQLFEAFLLGVWLGATRVSHFEILRCDDALRQMFGWRRMPGHRAFARLFAKFSQQEGTRIFNALNAWLFGRLKLENHTLDFDSTVMTRYGAQEGAAKGYNPQKPGRRSHHPLLAFASDCRMAANCWMRPGNTSSANNFHAFLEETLALFGPGREVGLIRADSAFAIQKILAHLEAPPGGGAPHSYVMALAHTYPLQRLLADADGWINVAEGIDIKEAPFKARSWDAPRRVVMVRQEVRRRPKAAGRQLTLFDTDPYYQAFRYTSYVTNLTLPAKAVYDPCRGRADCENRIKELKYDFGADSFAAQDFWATEAMVRAACLAYNLMSLFRQVVIRGRKHEFLRTLRHSVFALGFYVVRKGSGLVFKLALPPRRRRWFTGLWETAASTAYPAAIGT
jgi:hypothetical protein